MFYPKYRYSSYGMWKYYIYFCITWCSVIGDQTESYSGAKVYEVVPDNQEHLRVLQGLNSRLDKRSVTEEDAEKISFWKDPHSVGVPVHFMVHERHDREVTDMLSNVGIQPRVMIDDVGQVIQDQEHSNTVQKRDTEADFYSSYHSYEEIMSRIDDLVEKHSLLVKKTLIGKSHEQRDLVVLELKTRSNQVSGPKKTIWIDGGIHAREWISPATTMYILERLLENPDMMDKTDFYVMPLMNPDGYAYTKINRMWRKNRATNPAGGCQGVDLNRNFDYMWREVGASADSCDETYAGPTALSEPESQATADFLKTRLPDLDVYLTLHSYGQEWMGPWGYTLNKLENVGDAEKLRNMGEAAVKAIRSVPGGEEYVYGSAAELAGLASGASDDWSYNRVQGKGKYSYTVELRDKFPYAKYGFLLPAEQIIPTGKEMWAAVQCVNKKLHGNDC